MIVYIVRHGIAQEPHQQGVRSDAERSLTKEGRERTREVARGLRALDCKPDRVASSPHRRAEETARIMAEVLNADATVELCDFLTPERDPGDAVAWLQKLSEESIMVVGHMPDVNILASVLLAGRADIEIEFKKAAVCCIRFEDRTRAGAGALEWLLQPGQLRALAAAER